MNRALALGPKFATKPRGEAGMTHWQPTVDPEAAKYLMDTMIAEAGVEMFFHSWGVDTIQDGDAVKGVVFQSKQGPQAILAKQVVEARASGDSRKASCRRDRRWRYFLRRRLRLSPDNACDRFRHEARKHGQDHGKEAAGESRNRYLRLEVRLADAGQRRQSFDMVGRKARAARRWSFGARSFEGRSASP